ncbi:TPA: LysM peptidoglycan-binding domain-containing protein [Enterobacter hormaechei]|nr:LysM peptidoglycan-binding domain-containing protein [Enterobacter hormaechei]HDV8253005.1 LysM peptidoglycan-binding domain-containing protein [Enterobacter hormaechei]
MSHNFISATYNTIKKRAMYKMADGTVYIREGGTIPWRTQNPCNVRPNGRKESQYLQPLRLAVAVTVSGKFGMYGCEVDGWETEKKLLRSDLYRNCTISEMAKIHSPEKDGNDPVKYAKDILAESGVSPLLTFGNMDDATLETVMKAVKKEEGYYNLKETRVEKWVYTTNITVTDGVRPAVGFPLKVIAGTRKYDCKTDKYGRLAPIVHKTEGMNIEVKAANLDGEYETIYSAQAGNESKNIVLKRYLVQYKSHTLAHDPEPPHEKSQPEPIEYIVQSGDNLSKVAARYEVSVSELVESNRIKDPNKIYPGQKIVIYGKKEPDNVNSGEQSPQVGNGESYPVPPNDPRASADNTGNPVDGPLSSGGWTPDTTDGADSSPAETGGAASSGTGESLPPYPDLPGDPTAGAGNTDHTSDGAGGQKSGSSQTTTTPDKPTNLPTVGGKDSGNPVAIISHEQKEAPWMVVAYEEAEKRWKWGRVKEANGGINYHKLTGASNPTMAGDQNAWCASFINYCLKLSGYKMSGTPNSQFFSKSPDFKKIDTPIFGAITVFHKKGTKKSGHVNLVYCKTKDGEIGLLGGNQTDSVTINPRYAVYDRPELRLEFIGFYVPVSYYFHAKEIIQKGGDLTPVFDNIGSLRESLGANKPSEKDGKTR